MAENKEARKYFENLPYGKDAKSSEIHGKRNQQTINGQVSWLVSKFDEALSQGKKDLAGTFRGAIHQIARDLGKLKEIKKHFAIYYGGGTGGKNLFSNWTNLEEWDIPFFLEKGKIAFNKNLRLLLSVKTSPEVTKTVEDITENWVIKGTEEADFMRIQQDAVKQSNTMGVPLDFDVNFAINSLLTSGDNWKKFFADGPFLEQWVDENAEALNNGEIPDEMLHPESFNPEYDPKKRLHKYLTNRVLKGFEGDRRPTTQALTNTPLDKRLSDIINKGVGNINTNLADKGTKRANLL